MSKRAVVWEDRKRNFLGLPWTFTKYTLTPERLFINTGFLNSREDEVRLYRITDMTLTRSLWQKITKVQKKVHGDRQGQATAPFLSSKRPCRVQITF